MNKIVQSIVVAVLLLLPVSLVFPQGVGTGWEARIWF
jgi:hypothetical protein